MARILIVEDEASVIMLMRFVLEKVGHKVQEAHNGREALALLGAEPEDPAKELPELILLDVMMPFVDGFTVACALNKSDRLRAVPIMVVTAKSEMRRMFDALPNVKSFFAKPFDPAKLRAAVDGLLDGRR